MGNRLDSAPGEKLELSSGEEQHPLAADEWLASRILECLADPRAVCRLALVNKNFSAASNSDLVWRKLLPPPPILDPLLPHLNYQPSSQKLLFLHLRESITYDNGLKKFWLDPATGGECHMISARALSIVWGDTPRYWQWESYPGSMFAEVARLCQVCWFDVSGTFQNVFRPGRYVVSFRLQLHSTRGWQRAPVKLTVQNMTHAHSPEESRMPFDDVSTFKPRPCLSLSKFATSPKQASDGKAGPSSRRSKAVTKHVGEVHVSPVSDSHDWVECDVGVFVVDDDNEFQPIKVNFSMREVDIGMWKGGLFVDGAIIRPSYVVDNIDDAGNKGLFVDGAIIRPSYVVDNIDDAGNKGQSPR